jgi:SAM-dependent methyltransferase
VKYNLKGIFKNFFLKSLRTTNLERREKWLKNVLLDLPVGSRILDAGAGEQQYRRFCNHLNYVTQDFAQYNGTGNGEGLQMGSWDQSNLDIISDITAIPEPDASFDAIMCVEVFEHLPEPIKAIQEFARLLKPGGHLILTAPFCSLTHFAPFHFYSGFNRYFYQKWLKELGFDIIEIVPNGNYFEFLQQEIMRLNLMSRKYAIKAKSLSLLEYFAIWKILRILKRFSENDLDSDNTLCYGYNVLSKKQNK